MTETFWLFEFAQKAELANHSVVAGDFNFDKSDKIEECVITSSGYRDVMQDFLSPEAFTMHKAKKLPASRPDKIVM